MTDSTREQPSFCPAEGCTAVQLMKQRQDDLEKEHESQKARNTELFDRLFQRFDTLQWWLIGLLVSVVLTLIAVMLK